jgi:uncharacterized protein YbbK (DUF523 family)
MASARPVLVVSRCLLGRRCRYDGTVISCPAIERLKSRVRLVPVCPEVEIGLGVPRAPIRIVRQHGRVSLVQPATGQKLTRRMNAFARRFLDSLPEVDGFVLKSRSPSCGNRDAPAYASATAARSVTRGAGFFAEAVRRRLPTMPVVDETQLRRGVLCRALDLPQPGAMISRRRKGKR